MAEPSVFVPYRIICGYSELRHPSDIVETKSLASISMQKPTYKHHLPLPLLDKDQEFPPLSGVQLDAVLLAGEAHSKMLESSEKGGKPSRRAFLIGDGAGVGKGRTLAGIIYDNFRQGREKSLWISCSRLLSADAERDLKDLTESLKGSKIPQIHLLPSTFEELNFQSGILFTTYATIGRQTSSARGLNASGKSIFRTRVEQIAAWLGGDSFDGVVVFDEAHKAKGFKDVESSDNKSEKVSRIGTAVVELQSKLPNARVVYVSATIATDIKDMEFMFRLGLWGTSSTAFRTAKSFFEFVQQRGIGGCEVVACEMKHRRLYLSRHLSFGDTEFQLIKVQSETTMTDLYNKCAELWKLLIAETPLDNKSLQSQLWATSQKFFKALCISAKLPQVIHLIKQNIQAGNCVIVGIQSTGEAAYLNFRSSSYHTDEELFSPCRVYLENFILKTLKKVSPQELGLEIKTQKVKGLIAKPGKMNEGRINNLSGSSSSESDSTSGSSTETDTSETSDSSNESPAIPIKKKKMGNTTVATKNTDANIRRICDLFLEIRDKLPANPLDVIQAEIGYESVAELTGRKVHQKLVSKTDEQENRYVSIGNRFIPAGQLKKEHQSFQEWTTELAPKVAIISEAASTGISLHSSRTSANRLPRVHIILEAPWTATQTCQQIGRTHRANQKFYPRYYIVMSDIPGEARFATALAGRMESLGALCKGDRKSSHGTLWQEYELDAKIAKRAIRDVINCILGNESTVKIFENERRADTQQKMHEILKCMNLTRANKKEVEIPNAAMTNYEKFLNRILCCDLTVQEEMLHYLDLAIGNIKPTDLGTIEALSSHIRDANFSEIRRETFKMSDEVSCTVIEFSKSDLFTWSDLVNLLKDYPKKDLKFFSKTCTSGRKKVCVGIKVTGGTKFFQIVRPCTRNQKNKTSRKLISKGYKETTMKKMQQDWMDTVQFLSSGNCTRMYSANRCLEAPCSHKQPSSTFAVVSGGILKLWDNLDSLLDKPIAFVRHTDEHGQLLGIFIPQRKIKQTKRCVEIHFGKPVETL